MRTEWRRCIRCLKLQVSFGKRATNHNVLLRKIAYKDKASSASLPPCSIQMCMFEYVCTAHYTWGAKKETKTKKQKVSAHRSLLEAHIPFFLKQGEVKTGLFSYKFSKRDLQAWPWFSFFFATQWNWLNWRSLLQNIVSFIGLFFKRDLRNEMIGSTDNWLCAGWQRLWGGYDE